MTKLISLSVLGLVALSLTAPPAHGATVFPYDVQRHTLDNGLKILMIPMPSDGLVAYWSVVRTGSRDEVEKGVTGFAHFFEHMMFRGSKKYPASVYDDIVTSMGADANAFTTDDLTAFHLSITRDDLPTVIDIESDRFQNLEYDETGFKTESGAVYGEFRKGRTNPFFVLFEATQNAAFDVHTYKHTTIGFEDDIKAMPEQFGYSRSFFNRFYRPENVVVMVVGDFDPEATLPLMKQAYGGWKTGYVAPNVPVEPEQKGMRRIDVKFPGRTLPILSVSFKGDRLRADDRVMAAATLIEDLAFGETSALYKKLVLDEQRLQFLAADFGFNRDPGLWSIFGMVKNPSDVSAVESEIWATIRDLQRHPVSQQRLDDVRSNLKFGFLSSLSTPGAVASNLARFVALTGDMTVVEDLWSTYGKVTPADIQKAANLYLTRPHSTVAVLHTAGQEIPSPEPANTPVLLPQERDPNVAIKLAFTVGSQDDPPGKEGLAALTATLISEGGTTGHTYDEILARLFPLAAGYDVSVDKEMTVLTGVVHRDALDAYYPLLTDAILNPGFRDDDFERLRSRAIDLLSKQLRYSSDEELGKAALYGTVFAGTPYAHQGLGTVEGLSAITIDDVKSFYRTHFTQDAATIGLGGAYGPTLLDRLAADLSRLPDGPPTTPPAIDVKPIHGHQVVLVEKPGESTAISFGFPIDLHRGSREFYALWVASSWLGEHRNSVSHLYQVIREARGMNYGDYAYIEAFPNGGSRTMPPTGVGRRRQIFEVWIRPVPDNRAVFALRAALREVDHLATHGLTAEQFETQRTFLKKYVAQFATTTAARLGYAVDDRFYGIDGDGHLARFRKMMDEVTLDDVNAAIHRVIATDNTIITMVTADAAGMKKALVSGAPSPIDYGDIEKPASILDEDKEIETYPLGIEARNVRIIPVGEMFQK
ncbi:MAG: M16 family metallopeptidase [Acidobacteriota bacterium]